MARVFKHNPQGSLRKPIDTVVGVSVRIGRLCHPLTIVRPYELTALLGKETGFGTPAYFALEKTTQSFRVCPSPDRRYDLQILGLVYITQ
jgi:hypothetical protein